MSSESPTDPHGRSDGADSLLLQCEQLTKAYGSRVAVSGLDLAVDQGEIVGFLGPNGAGKTTTLLTLLGLLKRTDGAARILGQDVPAGPEAMRRIGVLFERPAFYPWMSGRRNMRILTSGVEVSPAAIEGSLERVGLTDAASRKVRTYSDGMKQRLALATALAGDPELLILDEPGSGLDPAGVRMFRDLITEAAQRGAGVLLSSHLLSEVERSCDRVVIINKGRTVASGPLKALGGDAVSVEVIVGPEEESRALELLAAFDARKEEDGRIVMRAESGRTVTEILARAGIYPHSVTVKGRSLEDLFFELTEGDA